MLIYCIFWSLWRSAKEDNADKEMVDILKSKIKRTFLLKSLDELVSWEEENYEIEVEIDKKINLLISGPPFNAKLSKTGEKRLDISPIYIQPAGMGIYYKGIYSMKNIIEKAASGLQTLSWFYLAIKYGLLGEILLIDEPETNLHPEYIDKLSMFLVELSKKRKVFVATHSDYLLESLNKQILKRNLKMDVWVGKLGEKGAFYTAYQADKENLIDTFPLSSVYMDILRESFGYEA